MHYQIFDIEDVIRAFVKGCRPKVDHYDWYYDVAKGKVIFKWIIFDDKKEVNPEYEAMKADVEPSMKGTTYDEDEKEQRDTRLPE